MKAVRLNEIGKILRQARKAAVDYYLLTGKPLGITAEIGEYEAARCLGLELMEARAAGFDAIDKRQRKIQIKTRSIPTTKRITGQKIGSIKLKHEWDILLLVLLDDRLMLTKMYEATRRAVTAALNKTKSKARARGALTVSEFVRLGKIVWPKHSKRKDNRRG